MKSRFCQVVAFSGLIWSSPAVPVCVVECPFGDEHVSNAGAVFGIRTPDLNSSGNVSLSDFAIFSLSYPTAGNPAPIYEACRDFNCSGAITLADFSIFGSHYDHVGGVANACELL